MSDTMIPAWVGDVLTPVEKLEVHKRGLRHKAVSVFVMSGSSTLIQRRALGKYHTPGLWANTCCTHPEWGEGSRDCAIRRLSQELGVSGLNPVLADHVEYRADVGGDLVEHEEVDIFVAQADLDLHVVPDPDEVMDLRWIEFQDLLREVTQSSEQFTPWLRIYLERHRSSIFGNLSGG